MAKPPSDGEAAPCPRQGEDACRLDCSWQRAAARWSTAATLAASVLSGTAFLRQLCCADSYRKFKRSPVESNQNAYEHRASVALRSLRGSACRVVTTETVVFTSNSVVTAARTDSSVGPGRGDGRWLKPTRSGRYTAAIGSNVKRADKISTKQMLLTILQQNVLNNQGDNATEAKL